MRLIPHIPPVKGALGLREYASALRATFAHVGAHDTALISAGVAFYAMLSLFPGLAAVIAVMGIISDPAVVLPQLEEMRVFLPADVYQIIFDQVSALVGQSNSRLGWAGAVSLGLALWSARAGVGAMITGLSTAYSEPKRGSLQHQFRALWLTLSLVGVGLMALLSLVVIPVLLSFLALGAFSTLVIDVMRWAVMAAVLLVGIALLYRYGPNRHGAPFELITPGAIVAVVLWVALSAGFSFYVANFGNYNEVYGSIGAVMAMLTWLWISSFLVIFGAVLNAQLEGQRKLREVSPTLAQSLAGSPPQRRPDLM